MVPCETSMWQLMSYCYSLVNSSSPCFVLNILNFISLKKNHKIMLKSCGGLKLKPEKTYIKPKNLIFSSLTFLSLTDWFNFK